MALRVVGAGLGRTGTGSEPPDRPALARHRAMVTDLLDLRFTPGWETAAAAKAA
jgi:hypothetical protein